jgi:hypothetical protein
MDSETLAKIAATWAAYSGLTRALIVGASLTSLATVGLWTWAWTRMNAEAPDAGGTTITNTVTNNITVNQETHNHYHLGDIIPADAPLATGWTRQLQHDGRTTVEAVGREEMDFGSIETKTVAEVSPTGQVTALFRFINILEGGSWDLNSWTVLRDAGGQEVPLVDRFKAGAFGDRLQFADDIVCVGLSSRQAASDETRLNNLSYGRALTLARAITQADVMHHPQALYLLHLGGATTPQPIGSPSEPGQRVAVIIGVQRANKDATLSRDIVDVVARAELTATKLTDYVGATDADKRLRLAAPEVFRAPTTARPTAPPGVGE